MPLTRVSEILHDADQHQYGVAAFNVFNYESIAWAVEAAELEGTPILVQYYPGFAHHMTLTAVAAVTKILAAQVKVAIGLHLDHSNTFEAAMAGIAAGYPSIMIDGSALPFEANLDLTRRVVQCAHAMGIQVEAELGCVGSGARLEDFQDEAAFTNPDAARDFVAATGVDSLAVSIGNAHGAYAATPNLQFELLEKLNHAVDIPLVLHGGSDIPDRQMQQAIRLGINKLNIATEYDRAILQATQGAIAGEASMFALAQAPKDAAIAFLRKKIRLFKDAAQQ